jgi:creatinine amidohydrolase
MLLADMSWPEVNDLDREMVVVIPTGSIEQHGPHLPVATDTLIATAVANGVHQAIPDKVLITPTVFLGASGHHLPFSGTLSASMDGYQSELLAIVRSLHAHGFFKFFFLNAHGGNTELNGIVTRILKEGNRQLWVGHRGYYSFIEKEIAETLEGPFKAIRHGCEAETSLMLHLHPEKVRRDKIQDDGLIPSPPVEGMTHMYDEVTQRGSNGFATLATAEKGKFLFELGVKRVVENFETIHSGYTLLEVRR